MTAAVGVQGYWLDYGDGVGWRRVTRAEYVTAERAAGFRRANTSDQQATGAFNAPKTEWKGSLVDLRGTTTDPNEPLPPVPEAPGVPPSARERVLQIEAHQLRAQLSRAQRVENLLRLELAEVRRQLGERDREVMRRVAPGMLQAMIKIVTDELANGDD